MSKAISNNSIIGIFMKTYCLSGDPVFAQFHAFFALYIQVDPTSCRTVRMLS